MEKQLEKLPSRRRIMIDGGRIEEPENVRHVLSDPRVVEAKHEWDQSWQRIVDLLGSIKLGELLDAAAEAKEKLVGLVAGIRRDLPPELAAPTKIVNGVSMRQSVRPASLDVVLECVGPATVEGRDGLDRKQWNRLRKAGVSFAD